MLFHNQAFEERLKFFELNICDFPVELTQADIDHTDSEQIILGLKELRQLFREIYTALDIFQEDEPLESLHNVTNALLFLYSAGFVGELCEQGAKWYLRIDKKQMKSHYKQSFTKPMEKLQHFGFYYEYYKNGNCVETMNKCTEFAIYCEQWDNLLLALSYIMQKIHLNLTADDYVRMQGLFYKLDYRSMVLKESTKRDQIDPFRADIHKTAGAKGEFLESLLKKIVSYYPLKVKIKLHEYYTPHWILQFYKSNTDKYVFNLNVAANTICLEIRLSIETVEALAARKQQISAQLKAELDKLGCIACNNQCKMENLKESNGVHYCTAYSEARLLMLYINSEEDVKSALMLLDFELQSFKE
ncbi:hypothetical protein [Desnuesiella massiliensis]|uniref:hypothetical protein n=1 Tax=Desnuesiella massiliensis TaxID=1650662 RepID=UPI0006E1D0EC|nr:hypothetical protein [Desnuesiella massiliensis]